MSTSDALHTSGQGTANPHERHSMTRFQLVTYASSVAPSPIPGINTNALLGAGLTLIGLIVLIGAFIQLNNNNRKGSVKDSLNWVVGIIIILGGLALVLGGAIWAVTSGFVNSFTG